jgi:phage gp36-like protein
MFLTADDYGLQIRTEICDLVTDGNSTLLEAAGLTAQTEMESYLRGRYDVEAIFTASQAVPAKPDQRNRQVVMYLVDMALYHLHSRQNPRNVPQIRQDRYDHAISWLKMARKGELSVGLPELPDTNADGSPNTDTILPRGGSLPKQRNTY